MTIKVIQADREAVARMIDPSRWAVLDGYLADTLRKYKGQHFGYDPEAFKDKASLAKADRILASHADPLRRALEHYADQYCEGWCEQSGDCANFDDCGGCLARRTLFSTLGLGVIG